MIQLIVLAATIHLMESLMKKVSCRKQQYRLKSVQLKQQQHRNWRKKRQLVNCFQISNQNLVLHPQEINEVLYSNFNYIIFFLYLCSLAYKEKKKKWDLLKSQE